MKLECNKLSNNNNIQHLVSDEGSGKINKVRNYKEFIKIKWIRESITRFLRMLRNFLSLKPVDNYLKNYSDIFIT